MNTTELLRELRKRGLTQIAISKRTQIPQPRLSRWESGVVPTGADDALRLKALLDEVQAGTPACAGGGQEAGNAA